MPFDVVIRNGTVVDGTGFPPYRADVGIADGTIVDVGRISARGREEVDAEGHVVTPGFIDGHTHMDAQVFWDPLGTCSCWHGVTTVVMGHCGFTLAPAGADQRHLVVRNLERAEDISGEAMAAGIDWTWTTFAEFLDAVDRQPKGINYAANIGHSALRTFAMGERAFDGPATDDELAIMEVELRDGLEAGAFGFTTSRTRHHLTSDGRPVASRLASWSEVEQLVRAMGNTGGGVFQFLQDPPSPDELPASDARLIALAAATGTPIAISAASGGHPLELIDAAAEAGGRMFGLTHPRGVGTMSSFRTRLPFDSLPEWQAVRSLPWAELRRSLRDPEVRRRLVWSAHEGAYGDAFGAEARRPEFDRMQVMEGPLPPHRTVADMARARGVDPVELILDVALDTDFDQFFMQTMVPFDEEAVLAALRHPRTVMSFSDAGAHVSQMSDCSIQTHLLAYWVRDRQEFTLEEAVRMLTLAPARAWGFHDRGLVRPGMAADLNIFDPCTVGPAMPTVVRDLPGGAKRIKQEAVGFLATVVGGQVVHRSGAHTGALPGRLLRGPLAGRKGSP